MDTWWVCNEMHTILCFTEGIGKLIFSRLTSCTVVDMLHWLAIHCTVVDMLHWLAIHCTVVDILHWLAIHCTFVDMLHWLAIHWTVVDMLQWLAIHWVMKWCRSNFVHLCVRGYQTCRRLNLYFSIMIQKLICWWAGADSTILSRGYKRSSDETSKPTRQSCLSYSEYAFFFPQLAYFDCFLCHVLLSVLKLVSLFLVVVQGNWPIKAASSCQLCYILHELLCFNEIFRLSFSSVQLKVRPRQGPCFHERNKHHDNQAHYYTITSCVYMWSIGNRFIFYLVSGFRHDEDWQIMVILLYYVNMQFECDFQFTQKLGTDTCWYKKIE